MRISILEMIKNRILELIFYDKNERYTKCNSVRKEEWREMGAVGGKGGGGRGDGRGEGMGGRGGEGEKWKHY